MDAQSSEDFSSLPNERRELGGVLPSQELLEKLMEGPRKQANFFNDLVFNDQATSGITESQISSELNSYETDWIVKHLKNITEDYQSLVLSSPENLPQRSELSFHIINQFIMPQWHRALVSPKYPKMDTIDLETAQIRLAMESTSILSDRQKFEGPRELFDNELRDFDAMINLLQLSIDGEYRGQPNLVVVPYPKIGTGTDQTDFLIFEPTDVGIYNKREVLSSEILDPAFAPGTVAVDLLKNLRVSTLSRRPEFQDKKIFHKLILSRETAKNFTPEI
jgi:hypothetical protein